VPVPACAVFGRDLDGRQKPPIPFWPDKVFVAQNPNVRAKIVKAMIGMSQQKKAMIKQRLTSSVSIFLTSPYLTIKIVPRAPIPTTTIDQPTINHMKNSDKRAPQYGKKISNVKIPMPNQCQRP